METARKLVKRTLSRDTHPQHSECREHSQNSQIKQPGLVEATASVEDAEPTAASSNFSKHSQNSLLKSEPKVNPGEAKVTFGDRDGQCLVTVSEFRELSPNSQVEMEGSEGRKKKQHKKTCVCQQAQRIFVGFARCNNVTMYQFQVFHGLKACRKLLV